MCSIFPRQRRQSRIRIIYNCGRDVTIICLYLTRVQRNLSSPIEFRATVGSCWVYFFLSIIIVSGQFPIGMTINYIVHIVASKTAYVFPETQRILRFLLTTSILLC